MFYKVSLEPSDKNFFWPCGERTETYTEGFGKPSNLGICIQVSYKHTIKSVTTETNKGGLAMNLCHGQMDPQRFLAV